MTSPLPFNAKTVLMASGQGSQRPGMGADLLDVPEVAATFALASDVLGRDVAALCASGEAPSRPAACGPTPCWASPSAR